MQRMMSLGLRGVTGQPQDEGTPAALRRPKKSYKSLKIIGTHVMQSARLKLILGSPGRGGNAAFRRWPAAAVVAAAC
jgi:hypothetical protein